MGIPTDSPEFATDATFAADGDTWSGDPTKADPGAPRRAEGYEPDTLPAEWLNWQFNLLGKWCVALLGTSVRCTVMDPGTWTVNDPIALGAGYTSTADAAYLWFEVPPIPVDCIITGAVVDVDPGAVRGVGSRMEVKFYTAPQAVYSAAPSLQATQEDNATGTPHQITCAVTETVVAGDKYLVRVESGTDGAHLPDACYGCVVTYTQP